MHRLVFRTKGTLYEEKKGQIAERSWRPSPHVLCNDIRCMIAKVERKTTFVWKMISFCKIIFCAWNIMLKMTQNLPIFQLDISNQLCNFRAKNANWRVPLLKLYISWYKRHLQWQRLGLWWHLDLFYNLLRFLRWDPEKFNSQ